MTWFERTINYLFPPPPVTRKSRGHAPTMTCPECGRQISYSPLTHRTALHKCIGGVFKQVTIEVMADTSSYADAERTANDYLNAHSSINRTVTAAKR